jgi:predicted ATPase
MATQKLHSNYQVRWKNYRRFEDTDWLTLTPLTVLLGANNGGKSSVLSPLLLLSQTLNSHDSEAPLLPYGPLIDLGNYRDFVHLHDTKRDLFFGLRFHSHEPKKKVKPVGTYAPGGIELTFKAGEQPQQVKLSKFEVTDIYNRPYFSRVAHDDHFQLDGCISLTGMTENERHAVHSATPMNYMFSPSDVLYELDKKREQDKVIKVKSFSEDFSHYLKAIGFTQALIRNVFDNLSYVGPLRARLRRFYRVSAEMPETVGSQGEHAANLFRRKVSTLKNEINRWVKAFEFGDQLRYKSLTDDVFQLTFVNGGEETNIADAGFGASQVLPLIIQAVAAPEDSLTLAEQPEIHLNPRLQCVLADLFVEMATTGHRVLVETHSEHMIVRLRRLVAEGKIPAEDVSLYFVEKTGGESKIRRIPLESNGSIGANTWPSGFFDDSLRESLALATAQAKTSVPKSKPGKAKNADA